MYGLAWIRGMKQVLQNNALIVNVPSIITDTT